MDEVTAAFRFGFGLPQPADAPRDPDAMLAALAGPDRAAAAFPAIGIEAFLPHWQDMRAARDALNRNPQSKALRKAERTAVRKGRALMIAGAQAMLARALDSPDSLRERLAAFWANHFTVVSKGRDQQALPTTLMEDAIRPHLAGRFEDMLVAVTTHPAMLLYLDQSSSIGPTSRRGKRTGKGLNENLAREVLELHTLGVGGPYSQADVRELAELFTGLAANVDRGFGFDASRAEPGAETVLGRRYGAEGLDAVRAVLTDLARHPATARHLARKLAVHFVADDPPAVLVDALAGAWQDSGGDLPSVLRVLLTHPAPEPGAKVRLPFEYTVCALRALRLTGAEVVGMGIEPFHRLLMQGWAGMGQPWQAASGPDGFPDLVADWIDPPRLAARVSWAMEVPARLVPAGLPDPAAMARTALGPRADERLLWAAARAETRREGVGLVLASPAFNRR